LQNPFAEQRNQKQGGMQSLMRERGRCQLTQRKWKEVSICVARDRERRGLVMRSMTSEQLPPRYCMQMQYLEERWIEEEWMKRKKRGCFTG
jgi:hypothetical protein